MTSLKRIALLFTISLLISSCDSLESSQKSLLDFIDPSWTLIYTIDDVSQVEKDLQDNVLIAKMSTTKLQQVLEMNPFIGQLPYNSDLLIALPKAQDTANNVLVIAKSHKTTPKDSLQNTGPPKKGIVIKKYSGDTIYQAQVGNYILLTGVKKTPGKGPKARKKPESNSRQTNGLKHF